MENSDFQNTPSQMTEVDESLVRYFLSLSPEERIASNDNAINTINEMRASFQQIQTPKKP